MKGKLGTCRVCYLTEGDSGLKEVEFCNTCDSWICKACKPNLYKRGVAMTIEKGLLVMKKRKINEQKLVGTVLIVLAAITLFILSH